MTQTWEFARAIDAVFTDLAELVAEFERHAADGRLSFLHNGHMVDAPHLARARTILARARINSTGNAP